MEIIKSLEQETSRINKILLKAQEAYLVVEYLYKYEEDSYLSYEKGMNLFFGYSRFIYWQITVIELSKLFYYSINNKENTKNRERFNLRHFIKKLKPNGILSKANISPEKITEWENRLNAQDSIVENLLRQRDKIYAHDDENNEMIKNEVSLLNIKELLEIVYAILDEINHFVFNRGISYQLIGSPVESLKFIINSLAELKRQHMEGYKGLARDFDLEDELK